MATKNIMFLNLICAPEGVQKMGQMYPEIPIVTGMNKNIVLLKLYASRTIFYYFFPLINLTSSEKGTNILFSLVLGCIDSHLNEDKYIVPGLGDYGDRYFGTT